MIGFVYKLMRNLLTGLCLEFMPIISFMYFASKEKDVHCGQWHTLTNCRPITEVKQS